MAFQTGTATSPANLISTLETLAVSLGWTVANVSGGKVFYNAAHSLYFGVAWDGNNIYIMAATGFNSGSAWNAQPGNSGNTTTINGLTSPLKTYWMFCTDRYLHVAIEVTTNVFRHIAIGILNKNSTYTGGQYCCGTYHNTSTQWTNQPDAQYHTYLFDSNTHASYKDQNRVRVDVDGLTNNWMTFSISAATNRINGCSRVSGRSLVEAMYIANPNSFNQRTTLVPIILSAYRTGGLYSLIGSAPDMRLVNMTNLNPGQVLTIGSDEWYVFPNTQKTSTSGSGNSTIPSSGMYGYAYKKVA